MKYLRILLLLIFVQTVNCYSQDLSKLDSKYGMKKFQLESNLSNYKPKLSLLLEGSITYYKYEGTDVKTVFDADINEITLGFYNNKLYYVGFVIDNSLGMNEAIIYDKLRKLFGPTRGKRQFTKGPFTYSYQYMWESNKATLVFEESDSYKDPLKSTKIWLTSNVLEKEKDSADF